MTIITALLCRIRQAKNYISKDYKDEIRKELVETNYVRVNILSVILLIINIFLLIVDIAIYYKNWGTNYGYINLFYSHIVLAIERSLYLLIAYIVSLRNKNHLYKLKKCMVFYSCIFTLGWCSYLCINSQATNGQISSFIIGVFYIASIIHLSLVESFFIIVPISAAFISVLYLTSINRGNFVDIVVNTVFVIVFALIMSFINTSLYCKNYINNKIIKKQSQQLEESRNKLEDTVKQRTAELVKTSEDLIKEIGIRHEIELQSIRTKLMYEENERLLSEIKEYEELRNVFFANLSHELRTPLNVIFSAQQMMGLILSKNECDECKTKLEKYNGIVKQNCYRLIRLIGNLIDITKIDAKHFQINKKNCNIVRLIEYITESVAEYIKEKNIELSFYTEIKDKIIACDPDKIERIMLNLLSNAVKFTPEHGVINVRLYNDKENIIISVKDSGIGISKEMQSIIFERFIQADNSTTRSREGSGIGLSLVKSIVDLHQGSISISSVKGKGSEFIVKLPDKAIHSEDGIACCDDTDGLNIDRINIEFSDIYS